MKRFEERRADFYAALQRLQEALEYEINDVTIDGVLHRFEFTFELSWKTLKDYLEYLGVSETSGSPREVIQLAFKQGIIEEGEQWIKMMISRNMLSHMYDENISREIYNTIKNNYINLFTNLKEKFEQI